MRLNIRARAWLPWLLLAIAVIVTAVVYWPGVTGGWVFDDYPNIVDNAAIHITPANSTLAAWVNSALSSPSSFLHRPLASLTFSVNWYLGGGDPWPFKVTNIVIHLVNGVLLYFMLRALLRLMAWKNTSYSSFRGGPQGRTRNPAFLVVTRIKSWIDSRHPWRSPSGPSSAVAFAILQTQSGSAAGSANGSLGMTSLNGAIDDSAATRLALIVSAAWLLLPINLMAVLYVVQRMESLCQIFVLAGLWAYLHGRWMMLTASDARRDRHGFALATTGIVAGTLLGLTSKETAVLLPVFAFLAEWILLRFASPPNSISWIAGDGLGMTGESLAIQSAVATPSDYLYPNEEEASAGARTYREKRKGEGRRFAEPLSAREGNRGEGTALPPSQREGALPTNNESGMQDKRIWTLFTITLFIPGVLGFLWLLRGALTPASWSGRDFTLGQRLLTEPRVLVDYLHWTLFPNPMVLSLYHDEIVKSTGLLTPWTTLGSIILLAALIVIAVLLRNRRPLVSLGISWFFAAQLLTATIIPLELVYEQRMYFGSIGVLLAVGALLLGLRWKIALPIPRGFVVGIALLWFALATNLRAQEWSNPLRLAIAEADRHPESARAVYEAGRLLLIASNYQPGKALDESRKYLASAAAIPGSSSLADQALIMIADHHHQGADADYWNSMIQKLRDQPTRQEDISALISLTNCYGADICKFDVSWLQRAYAAALSRPHPIARLDGAYADFERDLMHNDAIATKYLARAVANDPSEPAYRVDLGALYARQGKTEKALEQIDALRRMNLAGRLDKQIAFLEPLAEQGKIAAPSAR